MGKKLKFYPELFFTFLLMVLGFVIMIVSKAYGFGSFKRPGPGLYPFFVSLIIVSSGMILLILGLKSKSSEPLFNKNTLKIFLLMFATFIIWIIAMPLLGYVIITFVTTYCFCKVMRLEGWIKPLALSVGTALFIYVLFDVWLYIDLPRGILGK